MPLIQGARELIIAQLTKIKNRERVQIVEIGSVTDAQFEQINSFRSRLGFPALGLPTIVYLGRHHYESRNEDGYTIEDMADQLESALLDHSVVVAGHRMIALQNKVGRHDNYGNFVRDMVILELTSRKPRGEAFSTIPKGDIMKPPKAKAPPG